MRDEASFLLRRLFDASSLPDSKPWHEIAVRTVELLQHRASQLVDPLGSPLVRLSAPPFELVLNLSLRELKVDGDPYGPGELVFRRGGQRVASFDFLREPEGCLKIHTPPGEELGEARRLKLHNKLEIAIVDALKARSVPRRRRHR